MKWRRTPNFKEHSNRQDRSQRIKQLQHHVEFRVGDSRTITQMERTIWKEIMNIIVSYSAQCNA